ncbi:hypothetical protein J6590_006123, partial [Homalodisca vitripennis]
TKWPLRHTDAGSETNLSAINGLETRLSYLFLGAAWGWGGAWCGWGRGGGGGSTLTDADCIPRASTLGGHAARVPSTGS